MTVKSIAIAAGIGLAMGSNLASAAIGYQGNVLSPGYQGEIYITMYNGTNQSFTKDTGIQVQEMLTNPASFYGRSFDLGLTPESNWVWNVKGGRADNSASLGASGFDGNAPTNFSGVVTTVSPNGPPLQAGPTYFSYDQVVSRLFNHGQALNEIATEPRPLNFAAHNQHAYGPTDSGYFLNVGSVLSGTLFQSAAPVSVTSMPMYFLTATLGPDEETLEPFVGKSGQALGLWRLIGSTVTFVPVPAAVWLFGSAVAGLATIRRHGRRSA